MLVFGRKTRTCLAVHLWNPGIGPASIRLDCLLNRPALYEFGAGHCVSCKEMAKIIEELKTTIGDKVEFRMIYADKEKPLFQQYKIMLIPTQVFLNAEGKEVDRHVGALTKEQVLAKLKELKFIAN